MGRGSYGYFDTTNPHRRQRYADAGGKAFKEGDLHKSATFDWDRAIEGFYQMMEELGYKKLKRK